MSSEPKPNLSPTEQLQVLEDSYAGLMTEEASIQTLSALWNQIKTLRQQLGLSIHHDSNIKAGNTNNVQ